MARRFLSLSALLLGAIVGIPPAFGQDMSTPRPPTVLTPRGTTTVPARGTTLTPSPSGSTTVVVVPPRQEFPPTANDPIERADFLTKAHPIKKSTTSAKAMVVMEGPGGIEMGSAEGVIAIVSPGTRQGKVFDAVFVAKQATVGKEMKTSFDEAVRAVKMRYPSWEPGKIEFSFQDKYTGHDGGSAGTCFSVLLLSMLEGFDIEEKFAVTGDITVDWKVLKIGAVADKVRGAAADGCLYAAIPEANVPHLGDMALLYGDGSLYDIQVFSISTLQEAVGLMRVDRLPRLARAMKEFSHLQPKLKTMGRSGLSNPNVQKALEQILVYAPNHQSAKTLLDIGKGTGPKQLSASFALDQLQPILSPYMYVLTGRETLDREGVTPSMTAAARKQLTQIRPLLPRELQAVFADVSKIVETCELIAQKKAQPPAMTPVMQAFKEHYQALVTDRALLEKLIRD